MADLDHTNLNTSQVHEPKHISATTSSDAGKVITPSSSGESELRNLTPDEVGVVTEYGQVSAQEIPDTDTISISAASDSNLYDSSDYVELNSTRLNITSDILEGVSFDDVNNRITVSEGGDYAVNVWSNMSSDTNNTKIGLRNTINGTPSGFVAKNDFAAVDRVENLNGFGIVNLSAGDTISVSIAADQSAEIHITDLILYVKRL